MRSSTADADAPSAAPVLDALRERMLERNYINNLLAGIERETGGLRIQARLRSPGVGLKPEAQKPEA